jgi:hypothetical protein
MLSFPHKIYNPQALLTTFFACRNGGVRSPWTAPSCTTVRTTYFSDVHLCFILLSTPTCSLQVYRQQIRYAFWTSLIRAALLVPLSVLILLPWRYLKRNIKCHHRHIACRVFRALWPVPVPFIGLKSFKESSLASFPTWSIFYKCGSLSLSICRTCINLYL